MVEQLLRTLKIGPTQSSRVAEAEDENRYKNDDGRTERTERTNKTGWDRPKVTGSLEIDLCFLNTKMFPL